MEVTTIVMQTSGEEELRRRLRETDARHPPEKRSIRQRMMALCSTFVPSVAVGDILRVLEDEKLLDHETVMKILYDEI